MKLKDKVALITGAGQGIGKAIALKLASEGASVVVADLIEKNAKQVEEEIINKGNKGLAVNVDVSSKEQIMSLKQTVIDNFGRLDVLVNNAGISPKGARGEKLNVVDIEEDDWDNVMTVNVKGAFLCSQAFIEIMMQQEAGKIVNIASIAGLTGGMDSPAAAHYCVSKAAVICLTKSLALELAPYNVNVNSIAPGRIATEMAAKTSKESNERALSATPLGRFGKEEDVANAVAFLVSEEAGWITGETMVVDGGRVMR